MRLDVLLADSAQVDPNGKVHALGLGWTATVSPTPAAAVVVFMWAGWTEANQPFDFRGELVDSDGNPGIAENKEPVAFWGRTEVGRPPGLPEGSELMTPLVVAVDAGLMLRPGQRYEWRKSVQTRPEPTTGRAAFSVRGGYASA